MAETTTTSFDAKLPIYIPRIDTRSLPLRLRPAGMDREEFVKQFIVRCFQDERIGKVKRVDLLEKTTPDGWNFYVAFCHFEEWYDNDKSRKLQEDIKTEGVKAKFFFDTDFTTHYWILNENKKPISEEEARLNRIIYDQERALAMLRADFEAFKAEVAERDRATMQLLHQMMSASGQHKFQLYPKPYTQQNTR